LDPGKPFAETPEAAQKRHLKIRLRRLGPAVIVHRGATAFAPENSLAACAAAMDYGADGCEVDIRQTRDGVLVLFHDDFLDRLTDGFGAVADLTFRELHSLRPATAYGRPLWSGPVTLTELLDLARKREMLLHLDVKEPGLEGAIVKLLGQTDTWDHVVAVNPPNATSIRSHPRLQLLEYKGPGLYLRRLDVDPQAVRAQLARPGHMILVDDPRVAAEVLRRPPYQAGGYTRTLRLGLNESELRSLPDSAAFVPFHYLAALRTALEAPIEKSLLAILEGRRDQVLSAAPALPPRHDSVARIVEKAWAAQTLGQTGRRSRELIRLLERQLDSPTPHPDWRCDGLDAAVAARALGMLEATGSTPKLVAAFQRTPNQVHDANQRTDGAATAAASFRRKMYIMPALGRLRCLAAKQFLKRYVGLSQEEAANFGPAQSAEATQALLCQNLSRAEIVELLRSPNPTVRGTAILGCIDDLTDRRREALADAAPWALALPRRK
jgi:glycerophosphoryl diester phosphodiesterase